jgi:predicted transcriptional regulator of viral defense system
MSKKTSPPVIKPLDFFAAHPVFRFEEFVAAHAGQGKRSRQTSAAVLKHHVAAGNLLHIRRRLYATVPRGVDPKSFEPDPYLVATKIADDAAVAYHAALQFHGKVYSVWNRYHYLSRKRARAFPFRGVEFVPVQVPASLRSRGNLGEGFLEQPHAGGVVRVATLERTLVDLLNAPDRGGGWEEVWRSLAMVEFFDLDAVIDYTRKLGSAIAAGRVGFYLEQNRERLMVEDRHLRRLQKQAPSQPAYLDRRRQSGKLISRWNLVVPESVLTQAWEAVS